MEVFRNNSTDTAESASDATVCLSVAAAENGGTLQLSDSLQVANRKGKNDSTETCAILPGNDSSQIGASDRRLRPPGATTPDRLFSSSATLKGVTVPGYDILEELGRGGMGVVYKARHRRLQRLVALKMVLAGAHVGQVGLARFRAEAEAVAKLLHSNIVQIYETGEHEGRPYLFARVRGGRQPRQADAPRVRRLRGRPPSSWRRWRAPWMFAHQHGIVHRDLKPANILLAKLEQPVVR